SLVERKRGEDLLVTLGPHAPERPDELARLEIPVAKGKRILLKEVASVEMVDEPACVQRLDAMRCVEVTANPAPGASARAGGKKLADVAEAAGQKVGLPATYQTGER